MAKFVKFKLIGKIIIVSFVLLLEGCSYRDTHNALHNVAKRNCDKIINAQERFECKQSHRNANYNAYSYEYEKQ